MKITLSKALKNKNKLVKDIKELQSIVVKHNSVTDEKSRDFDLNTISKELNSKVSELIVLKTKIVEANSGIYSKIVELGEMKSHITFLKSINTDHGLTDGRYGSNPIEKFAYYKESGIRTKIQTVQGKIEGLQDSIDEYNFETFIVLD